MIPSTTPPSINRSLDNTVMTDRAIAGSDTTDRAAATTAIEDLFGPVREPLNRRGRRAIESEIRRSERRTFRSLNRQAIAEQAGR
jgi:hypothetical protein